MSKRKSIPNKVVTSDDEETQDSSYNSDSEEEKHLTVDGNTNTTIESNRRSTTMNDVLNKLSKTQAK